jgi:plasmid stabilization system protein ParE
VPLVVLQPRAKADLSEIWDFIADDSDEQADAFVDLLDQKFQLLARRGHKAADAERVTVFYGRRGRPVKKPRFISAERAHFWARRLQPRRLGSVSVV